MSSWWWTTQPDDEQRAVTNGENLQQLRQRLDSLRGELSTLEVIPNLRDGDLIIGVQFQSRGCRTLKWVKKSGSWGKPKLSQYSKTQFYPVRLPFAGNMATDQEARDAKVDGKAAWLHMDKYRGVELILPAHHGHDLQRLVFAAPKQARRRPLVFAHSVVDIHGELERVSRGESAVKADNSEDCDRWEWWEAAYEELHHEFVAKFNDAVEALENPRMGPAAFGE